jgi:hypothetical protein
MFKCRIYGEGLVHQSWHETTNHDATVWEGKSPTRPFRLTFAPHSSSRSGLDLRTANPALGIGVGLRRWTDPRGG